MDRTDSIIPEKGHQKPSLKYLNQHVTSSVGFKWYDLGIQLLDVEDVEALNQIEVEYPSDLNKCCAKMFQLWLRKQPRASWYQLIEALRQVKLHGLAFKIEDMLSQFEPRGMLVGYLSEPVQSQDGDIVLQAFQHKGRSNQTTFSQGKVMPVEYFSEPVRSQDGDIVLQASQQEVKNQNVKASKQHRTAQQQLDHDLKKFLNKAIKNDETITFQHIKVFLSGSSAAGKTNLRYALLGQKFVEEYESTHIQETRHAYVANNAGVMESEDGNKIWSELDLKEQLNYLKSLWEYRLEQRSKDNLKQNIDDLSSDDSEDEGLPEVAEEINKSEDLKKEIKVQEPVKLISMIDTGGQPGYIHMLPAIIHMLPASDNCPTVNLVVIDMTKSLEDNVLVRYRRKGQKEEIKPYHLHYTNKDLLKLLLSVTTDSFNVQMPNTPDVSIGFIGTHKDILDKEDNTEKIRVLDDPLSELIDQQNCQDVTIMPKNDRKYLYAVSNKTPNDAVILRLRAKIENLLDDVETVPLPIKWMILELAVKDQNIKASKLQRTAQQQLDQDLKRFLNRAIKNNETITFKHIKLFLSGSSAAGKTNLRYALLGQKFVEEYESTHIQETSHAYVANNAGVMESEDGNKIWSELDLKEQLNYFKSLWEYRLERRSKNNLEQNIDESSSNDGEDEGLPKVAEKINKCEGLKKEIKIQEPVKLISMIDTGGQPGYIHMLPAIIHMLPANNNCPTVNLVVVDMTKSLEDNVLVRYRRKGQKEEIKPYHLHYTNEDLVKLLLSVTTDSFNVQMSNTETKVTITQKPDVHIGFIGTRKDLLEKDTTKKIMVLDDQLSELIDQQNCQEFIIKPSIGRKCLHPVSNKTPDDEVVLGLRDEIEGLVDDVEPMPLPIKWMILELAVKIHCDSKNIPYITYQEFIDIAREEGSISEKEEAKKALYYFHSRGILLNFQEVPKMSNYVIVEHQWLYDQLSMLVTVSSESPSCNNGVLPKNKLPKIKMEGSIKMEESIGMENLISLLNHKKILASYTVSKKEYYYLPFVLPYCQHYSDQFKFLLLEPLLIRFSSGFLPRGFFCSLAVHFLQHKPDKWISLHKDTNKHFRNVMTFLLPNKFYLRLQDKIYYLEIQVRHYHYYKGEGMLKELEIVCKYLHEVCETLRFDCSKLQFGFFCHHGKWDAEGHMAVLLQPLLSNSKHCRKCQNQTLVINDFPSHNLMYCEKCDNQICCENCKKTTDIGELHKLWFKGVKETNEATGLEATPTLKKLNCYITDIAPCYYELGIELDIRNSQLKVIKCDSNLPSLTDKCQKMFEVWLESDICATWKKLCDALDEKQHQVLAEKIRKEMLSAS